MALRKVKVLVFPCGSECGLEIGRSLANLKEVELIGASSVEDHGAFCYENYIDGLPFVSSDNFIAELNQVVVRHGVQLIYPAMDQVVELLARKADELKAGVIGSAAATAAIACSKRKTYAALRGVVRCPREYELDEVADRDWPIFLKPEVGYGSRGTMLARNRNDVVHARAKDLSLMLLEYLPGAEYTVDCFSDLHGTLRFSSPRLRRRVARGISVSTVTVDDTAGRFRQMAEAINGAVKFNGAWFFQVKHAAGGELALLEIAPRIAGSMGLQRCRGVNLPLLSIFNQLGMEVSLEPNEYEVEFDRALYSRVRLSRKFTTLYLDFDDCLLLDGWRLNVDILRLVGQCRNDGCPVVLVTRHQGDLEKKLAELGIRGLFAEVIHLRAGESKADHLMDRGGLLVDDSFAERQSARNAGMMALGPDAMEALNR